MATWSACYAPIIAKSPTEEQDGAKAAGTGVTVFTATPLAIDPVEKKPLYQFHPGTKCLSVACTGCNLSCWNCQNHDISQVAPDEVDSYHISPQQLVDICKEERCPGIAFTYTEPLTYIEYVTDTARLAHEQRLWNILVTQR